MASSPADDWKHGPAPEPLRTRRGGSPALAALLYRDALVDRFWEHLSAGESILMTGEKRLGKTAVMRLLEARSTTELKIVMRDVEGVSSPRRLVEFDGASPGRERLRDLLRLLHEDHYLAHDAPTWRFAYGLIREAWLDLRDLRSVAERSA